MRGASPYTCGGTPQPQPQPQLPPRGASPATFHTGADDLPTTRAAMIGGGDPLEAEGGASAEEEEGSLAPPRSRAQSAEGGPRPAPAVGTGAAAMPYGGGGGGGGGGAHGEPAAAPAARRRAPHAGLPPPRVAAAPGRRTDAAPLALAAVIVGGPTGPATLGRPRRPAADPARATRRRGQVRARGRRAPAGAPRGVATPRRASLSTRGA